MKTFKGKSNFRAKPKSKVSAMAKKYGILEVPKQESGGTPLLEFNSSNTIASAGSLTNIIGDPWTVTRNSVATYNNSGIITEVAVNVSRIEDDTVLIESSGTNLVTYSEEFNQWTAVNATVTVNDTNGPDGTATADKIVAANSDNVHFLKLFATATTLIPSYSVYAKAAEYNYVCISGIVNANSKGSAVIFSLTDGSVYDEHGEVTYSPTYESLALSNGWYRITLHFDNSGTDIPDIFYIGGVDVTSYTWNAGERSPVFQGDGTSGIYVWGAQVEDTTSKTSYISTSGGTGTRQADIITITPPVGTASIIEWINNVEQSEITSIPGIFTMKNGTTKVIMR